MAAERPRSALRSYPLFKWLSTCLGLGLGLGLGLENVARYDAGGSYTCIARNIHRFVTATTVLEFRKPTSCSDIKTHSGGKSSGTYMIDPDGKGGVTPFNVYCDMGDKGGIGVTVISHDCERRTQLATILDVVVAGVTVKMCDTLKLSPLSWQHSHESHRTVNSLLSLCATMT